MASDIRKALGISSRSVVRYMDELERDGKVEQIGKIGYTVEEASHITGATFYVDGG